MTNYDLAKVGRARFAFPSSANFAVDQTTDVATNFYDIRHLPFMLMRETMVAKDETVRQRTWQQRGVVLGPDRASAQVTGYWTSTGAALNSATSPTKTPQSRLFEALLGGYYADQGSDVVASPSPTTTTFSVTTGHGTRFTEGQLISVVISSVAYPCMVTAISTDALTVWPALPSAPSAGDDVLNGQINFFADRPDQSLQVLCESATNRDNIWLGMGGQGDFGLTLSRNQLAQWASKITFAKHLHDDLIATPQSGGSIAVASYSGTGPLYCSEGGLHFGPTASTTRTLIRGDVSIGFDRKWLEIGDYSSTTTDGLGQWHVDIGEPTVEITTPFSETYEDAFLAGTMYGMLFWLGTTGGRQLAVACPNMQIAKSPEHVEWQGVKALKLTMLAFENDRCSDQSTEIRRTPVVTGSM